ncbi:unnamed protein product [Prunus armeniaca]|uniref:Uncharacterized protein n=1 Tax=Prunus armeniaca TaxID=36596 RepID=A0A6J5XXG4_PRUAR|nr:unnamed protein product [Prunus armeniaca]
MGREKEMGRFRYVDPAATSRPHSSARSSSKTLPTNKSPVSSTPPPKSAFVKLASPLQFL